jgi:hypothetical protein
MWILMGFIIFKLKFVGFRSNNKILEHLLEWWLYLTLNYVINWTLWYVNWRLNPPYPSSLFDDHWDGLNHSLELRENLSRPSSPIHSHLQPSPYPVSICKTIDHHLSLLYKVLQTTISLVHLSSYDLQAKWFQALVCRSLFTNTIEAFPLQRLDMVFTFSMI